MVWVCIRLKIWALFFPLYRRWNVSCERLTDLLQIDWFSFFLYLHSSGVHTYWKYGLCFSLYDEDETWTVQTDIFIIWFDLVFFLYYCCRLGVHMIENMGLFFALYWRWKVSCTDSLTDFFNKKSEWFSSQNFEDYCMMLYYWKLQIYFSFIPKMKREILTDFWLFERYDRIRLVRP